MILTRGSGNFVTLARVPQPRADSSVDNVPIFGEGAIDSDGGRAEYYARSGGSGWRTEASWNEKRMGMWIGPITTNSFGREAAGCR